MVETAGSRSVMSALRWVKLPTYNNAPPCANGCLTSAKARGVGVWRLVIIGWPAGCFCPPCRKGMSAAWESALEPEAVELAA